MRKYFTEAVTTSVSSSEDDTGSEVFGIFQGSLKRGEGGVMMLLIMDTITGRS